MLKFSFITVINYSRTISSPQLVLVSEKITLSFFFKVTVIEEEILSKISFSIFPFTGAESLSPVLWIVFTFKE